MSSINSNIDDNESDLTTLESADIPTLAAGDSPIIKAFVTTVEDAEYKLLLA
jgi:hypothetical protein